MKRIKAIREELKEFNIGEIIEVNPTFIGTLDYLLRVAEASQDLIDMTKLPLSTSRIRFLLKQLRRVLEDKE